MKKYIRDYAFLFGLAGVIIALDQWTKEIVRTQLAMAETWSPWEWLAPYARIVNWHNTGAAFGLGQNLSLVFTLLAIFVVGAIIFYFPQIPRQEWPLRIALGMQLGGATGNLIDRLTQGFVTDFISVGTFPVFNVADSSISIGVAVLIIGMWISERRTNLEIRPTEMESTFTPEEVHSE
ncbi:MAG: signal peptidase II [Chloroflexi bacterium]|nr:signal peptidase II [Chloroflexota bacterium]MBU1662447.1 signal peptidase II [Chloroflexota bacterium]